MFIAMRFLPHADVWIEGDAERLVTRVRAWRVVLHTVIGPVEEDEVKNDDRVYIKRAISVKSALDEYELNLRSGLPVQPERIAEDLEWILERVSSFTRNLMLNHYSSQFVDVLYDEMFDEFIKLRDALGSDAPEVQKLRLQLIAKGDQVDTLGNDSLRALLQLHPDALPRVPRDIKEQLGIENESDDESGESD